MGVNKEVIGTLKDELGEKIMKEFCALRAKTYTYLMDDDIEKKKAKGIKRCVIKHVKTCDQCLKTIKIHCSTIKSY